jgi:O-antigen/teichoic acid export membrane protein
MGMGVFSLGAMVVAVSLPPLLVFSKYLPNRFQWNSLHSVLIENWKEIVSLWINMVTSVAMGRVDKIILSQATSSDVVGIYNRAFNYSSLSTAALNAFSSNPAVVNLASHKHPSSSRGILARKGIILFSVGIISLIVFSVFPKQVVPFVF